MAETWTQPTFDDITTGEVVTAAYLNTLGNDLRFLAQVAYVEYTSDVSVTATTVGTANQIVSAGAHTYEAVPHVIEFYCPRLNQAAVANNLILRDSTTVIGTLGQMAASQNEPSLFIRHYLTPSAASHTYNVAAWNGAPGTWTYKAGTGGTAGDATTFLAGYIAVYRIPT